MSEKKPVRRYTVITAKGYWGKGETAVEAARNANVRGTYVHGTLYYADDRLVQGEIDCTGTGGYQLTWTPETLEAIENFGPLYIILLDACRRANGKMRIKGERLEVLEEKKFS